MKQNTIRIKLSSTKINDDFNVIIKPENMTPQLKSFLKKHYNMKGAHDFIATADMEFDVDF